MNEAQPTTTEERVSPEAAGHTPGEEQLWQFVSRLDEEWTRGRTQLIKEDAWEDNEKQYWGEQWDANLPSFKLPIVVNELKTLILNEVSDLTDTPLTIYVHKAGQRDAQVEKSLQAFWKNEQVDLSVMQAALDSMIFPAGFLMCTAELQRDGTYAVRVRAMDPRKVFPDPDGDCEETCRGFLVKDVLDLVQIREQWPERGLRVKPDDGYSLKSSETQTPWWNIFAKFGSANYKGPLSAPGIGAQMMGYLKARACVLTLFLYDDATEEDIQVKKDAQGQAILDAEGNEQLVIKMLKKYPNGRMIVAANGVVLFDGPYPYEGPFPIIRVIAEPTTHQFWVTTPPVQSVKELQRASNKLDSLVVENGIRLNNGMIVADTDSGLRPGQTAGLPGQVLLKRTGTQISVTYPPPMPPDMVQAGSRMREMMAKVLGWAQGRMGLGQRGNVSAELTETEISQAMGLTRLRARLLHASVQKLVTQIFYRMAQYYTVPRYIPSLGVGSLELLQWSPIASTEGYGVHVDPASFMLRSKTMLQRLTLQLAKMGKVSTKYLLTTLEMPDAEQEAARADQELAQTLELKRRQQRKTP